MWEIRAHTHKTSIVKYPKQSIQIWVEWICWVKSNVDGNHQRRQSTSFSWSCLSGYSTDTCLASTACRHHVKKTVIAECIWKLGAYKSIDFLLGHSQWSLHEMRHQMGILVSRNVSLSNFAQEKLDEISQAGQKELHSRKPAWNLNQDMPSPRKKQPVYFILETCI